MTAVFISLFVIIAISITNPLITIFHELGHAFAYLLLTKPDNINVFIGSHGNKATRLNFKIGRLYFYFNPGSPFIRGGMCQSSKIESNYFKYILILLAGPVFTLLFACIIGVIVFNTELHGAIKLYCFILIIFSGISLIRNLNPKPSNEAYLNNDGQQIAFTFRNRAVYSSYIAAIEDQLNNENSAAADKLLKIADTHPKEEKILRQLIPLLINIKSNDLAKKHLIALGTISSFDMVDYSNMGYLHSLAGEHENAMKNYRKALTIEPENSAVLNNLGYELVLTEAYQEADEILQKAIKLDPELPDPYSILGLLNVLTGKLEAGRVLIDKCLGLDPANAYAHKHLGIFYLKMKEKENAFINLKKAAELDSNINVDLYLQEAQLIN